MKTKIRKFISLIMLVFLVALPSCQSSGDEITTSTSKETTAEIKEETVLELIKDGKTEFTLFWPKNMTAEQEELITYFKKEFENRTGIRLNLTYEKHNDVSESDTYEILIGNTIRKESEEIASTLRKNDFIYGIYGKKLVIIGGCEIAEKNAVNYFIRRFLDSALAKDEKNIIFTLEDSYTEIVNYYLQEFKIGNTDAREYKIVFSENDLYASRALAYRLSELLTRFYGYDFPIITDKKEKSEYEIVIGETNRGVPSFGEDEFNVFYDDGKLYLHSSSSAGYDYFYTYLQNYFKQEHNLNIDTDKNATEKLSNVFMNGSEAILKREGDIRIIFNNVWSGNLSDAPAAIRAKQLAELYEEYNPDILCLQEFSGVVKRELSNYLKALGYREVPYATKNQNYAVCTPVFYNPNVVTLVDSGYHAYDDTANDKSKSIGWGVFEDKNGKKFCVASTHFYWTSDELGEAARKIDAQELCEQMKLVSEKHGNIPVIIGGDYNCKLGSDPLNILKEGGFTDIENTALIAEMKGSHHSYPSFNKETMVCTTFSQPKGDYTNAIDHIYSYCDDNLTVGRYDVIEDYFALASSDHCPLLADITLK